MRVDPLTSSRNAQHPEEFALYQNYPNPIDTRHFGASGANVVTRIRFGVPATRAHKVSLRLYDVLGREIATLIDEPLSAGEYTITFNVGELPSGVYYYRLAAGGLSQTKRMIVTR